MVDEVWKNIPDYPGYEVSNRTSHYIVEEVGFEECMLHGSEGWWDNDN